MRNDRLVLSWVMLVLKVVRAEGERVEKARWAVGVEME